MKCYIDPRCKINYASYYIKGFYDILGKSKVIFFKEKFRNFPSSADSQYRGMNILLVYEDGSQKKIYIDYHDSDKIIEDVYNYVDVYAKVNLNKNDSNKKNIIAIGPSFGIDIWNWFELFYFLMFNFISIFINLKISKKQYVLDYLYTKIRRKSFDYYIECDLKRDDKYLFNISTLWFPSYVKKTNDFRYKFYKLSKEMFQFKGGYYLIPSKDKDYIEYSKHFKEYLFSKRITMKDYIDNTKKSCFVFNTPAVQDCHGWKLGEYFALGKAIISTPLSNELPGPYQSLITFIESEEELRKKMLYLKNNFEAISLIEEKTVKYFNDYLSPQAVVQIIINS